jgi:hypothetical protein
MMHRKETTALHLHGRVALTPLAACATIASVPARRTTAANPSINDDYPIGGVPRDHRTTLEIAQGCDEQAAPARQHRIPSRRPAQTTHLPLPVVQVEDVADKEYGEK